MVLTSPNQWVETSEAARAEARARGEDVPDDEMLPFGQSSFGHSFDMNKPLGTLDEGVLYKRVTCSICADFPTEPVKTDVSIADVLRRGCDIRRRD